MKECKKCLDIIFRHYLKEIAYDIEQYEELQLLELIDEQREPLKTKELERYNELVENRGILEEWLDV